MTCTSVLRIHRSIVGHLCTFENKDLGMVKVEIEYCGGCGYGPRYEELSGLIREASPDVEVIGHDGRTASFEVEIDGELVYSKLEKGAFPDFKEVVQVVKSVVDEGEEPKQVEGTQSMCNIL